MMKKLKILLATALAIVIVAMTFASSVVMSVDRNTASARGNELLGFDPSKEMTVYLETPDRWLSYRFNIAVHFDDIGLWNMLSENNEMDAWFFLYRWAGSFDGTILDVNKISEKYLENITQGSEIFMDLGRSYPPGEYLFVMYVPATGKSAALREYKSSDVGKGITYINGTEIPVFGDWPLRMYVTETASQYFYEPGTAVPKTCADNNGDHMCDMCGERATECTDTSPKDHKCDICNASMGGNHVAASGSHICAYCGQKASDCTDTTPADHKCDICGNTVSECADQNDDHKCDVCNDTLSECTDEYTDHMCDVCGERISECYDNDDHKCDTCWGILSECSDSDDSDHACDLCGKIASECADGNNDHLCDECTSQMTYCNDGDGDDYCDICGDLLFVDTAPDEEETSTEEETTTEEETSPIETHPDGWEDDEEETFFDPENPFEYCIDNDGNHRCDDCGKVISICIDEDVDHFCDICMKNTSPCLDVDRNHMCDTCGERISECADANGDGWCERCGEFIEANEDKYPEIEKESDTSNDKTENEAPEYVTMTPPSYADTLETPQASVGKNVGCGMTLGSGSAVIALVIGCFAIYKKKKDY